MQEFNFVPARLEDIIRELGVSNYTGFLEEGQRKLQRIAGLDYFYCDIFIHSASGNKARQWVTSISSTSEQGYIFTTRDENTITTRVFEQLISAVAIIVLDETLLNSPALIEKIGYLADQYRSVYFLNFTTPDAVQKIATFFNYPIKPVVIAWDEDIPKEASIFFKQYLPSPQQINKFKRYTYINSIKPFLPTLDEIFISENRTAQTRKLLNTQNIQIARKDELQLNINDFLNNLRQLLMKFGQEQDKNFRNKYDDLNKPNTGLFSKIGQELSQQLTDFKREVMAEKNEKLSVTIEQSFQDKFLKDTAKIVEKELENDRQFLQAGIEDMLAKINIQLEQKKMQTITWNDVNVPFPDKKRITGSYCYIARPYTGEIIKKGPSEYFIALRDYIGVIMVATGLLAPLNMIASAGDDSESFFSFLKHLNKLVRLGTAVIAISLIIYGIFDLQKRIPRKREEEFKRELTKARELIIQEAKRIFNDSSRDWVTNISTWVKDISQNISNQIDKSIRQFQFEKTQQLNQDKTVQQRQQQSIDNIQRNIQSAERIKDQLNQKFRELIMETDKM